MAGSDDDLSRGAGSTGKFRVSWVRRRRCINLLGVEMVTEVHWWSFALEIVISVAAVAALFPYGGGLYSGDVNSR